MSTNDNGLRKVVLDRLKFIDSVFAKNGRLNRSDIVSEFEISEQQCGRDIKQYRGMNKGTTYDTSLKCYVTEKNFKPLWGNENA